MRAALIRLSVGIGAASSVAGIPVAVRRCPLIAGTQWWISPSPTVSMPYWTFMLTMFEASGLTGCALSGAPVAGSSSDVLRRLPPLTS